MNTNNIVQILSLTIAFIIIALLITWATLEIIDANKALKFCKSKDYEKLGEFSLFFSNDFNCKGFTEDGRIIYSVYYNVKYITIE